MDVDHRTFALLADWFPNSSFFSGAKGQQYVMLGLGFLGLTVLWLGSRRNARKIARTDRKTSSGGAEANAHAAIRDIASAMSELDALSAQIHSRLDAKISKLEALIRFADDRIDRLGRSSRAASGQSTLDILTDNAGIATEEESQSGVSSSPTFGDSLVPSTHDAIYRLADAGTPVLQIARQMNRPRGEIELILSLRATAQAARP